MNGPSCSTVRTTRHAALSSLAAMTRQRQRAGRLGERLAARHLERSGYRLVDRNYSVREGEIDLIATGGSALVFCEVKTIVARERPARGPAHPLEAIGAAKRRQVRLLARRWLAEQRSQGRLRNCHDIRFDAIGVLVSPRGELLRLEHVTDAF